MGNNPIELCQTTPYTAMPILCPLTFGVELPVRPKPITLQIELTTDQIRFRLTVCGL